MQLLTKYCLVAAAVLGAPAAAQDRICTRVFTCRYDEGVVVIRVRCPGNRPSICQRLFAVPRSCHCSPNPKIFYCDVGPPRTRRGEQQQQQKLSAGGTQPSGATPIQGEIRVVAGESACYGDPIRPNYDSTVQQTQLLSIDGDLIDVPFEVELQSLSFFLGPHFDESGFDSQSLDDLWMGMRIPAPLRIFRPASLTWSTGALNDDVLIAALEDLSNPDQKVMTVELGAAAALASVTIYVSGTSPAAGALMSVDGIRVPIVGDSFTKAYQGHPDLTRLADAAGRAVIPFPLVVDPALDGTDLYVAALASDATSGQALVASTFAILRLRDLSLCAK
jgi:hypothetical protein